MIFLLFLVFYFTKFDFSNAFNYCVDLGFFLFLIKYPTKEVAVVKGLQFNTSSLLMFGMVYEYVFSGKKIIHLRRALY